MVMVRPYFSYIVSLALHLGVFGLVSVYAMKPVAIPYGHYKKGDPMLVEIGLSSPAKTSVQSAKAQPAPADKGDVVIPSTKKEDKQVSEANSNQDQVARGEIGFKDGTHEGGELGHSKGYQATARERYLFELHVLIEGRKIYPALSKRLRESGKVTVQFTVNKDGAIQDVMVKNPSHFERLNSAASELINGIKRYKPLPAGFEGDQAKLEIPIEYSLN
ncbi:energy transducer TonB [Bdellovibrio sp. NC01]|uniref:energy transducer TonB n=1 Tax=Bdellovibrio sp. NC01 TaxID=2220073 RepID=UPI00115B3660|nr:energy transducer TonB [Bdellovibrio sp. NC01]QDK36801.1 hypothetical protein DOE51_03915 [Bdellovibrio sp. NC01]